MKNESNRIEPRSSSSRAAPARKSFCIQKLEERIAPKKGGKGTNNCGGSSNGTSIY